MNTNKEILNITDKIQNDCQKDVEELMKNSSGNYQDCTNVWMFNKLAELEYRLRKCEINSDPRMR